MKHLTHLRPQLAKQYWLMFILFFLFTSAFSQSMFDLLKPRNPFFSDIIINFPPEHWGNENPNEFEEIIIPDIDVPVDKIIIVTNGNDSGPGSLRQAILDVEPEGGIVFTGVSEVNLTGADILINKGVTIHGGEGVSINAHGNSRIFSITNGLVKLISLSFENGSSLNAGALLCSTSSIEISFCTFINNGANRNGGAIANLNSNITISNSIFYQNRALNDINASNPQSLQFGGGAIYTTGNPSRSFLRIVNSLFIDNNISENYLGAALLTNREVPTEIINTAFSRNKIIGQDNEPIENGSDFGTIANIDNASPVLTNSIIWGNQAGSIVGTQGIIRYSTIENGPDGNGNLNVDPLFLDPDSGDFRLHINSPLRDAGDPATDLNLFPRDRNTPIDLDSNPRVNGGRIDIGAFEIQEFPPLQQQVITISSPTDLTYGDSDISFDISTSSGLPVTYTVEDNPFISVTPDGKRLNAIGATSEPVTITITVEGNSIFESTSTTIAIPVHQRQLTITNPIIAPKEYDGSTSATITLGELENKITGDEVDISAVGTFDNPSAGTGKTVTVSYSVSGTDAGNYTAPMDFVSTDGIITPRDLFVTPFEGQRKAQGSEDPKLTFEAIGFVEGENESIFTGKLGRESGESCGNYDIINDNLDAGNNYTIILSSGVLFEIFDATPPTLELKNISVQLDNTGNASITIADIDNGTTDNCSAFEDLVFEISQTTFSCENTAPVTITVKVYDQAGNSSEESIEITVLQPLNPLSIDISSTIAKNQNGNVLIYANAPTRLAVPSSTVLEAINFPTSYTGLNFEWFVKIDENSEFISIAQTNSITITADGDFSRIYKLVVTSDAGCVAEQQISVISIETSCDKGGDNKVQVCHFPAGNSGARITLCVNLNAVDAFLRNNPGSFVGNCNITFRLEGDPEVITVPWNTNIEAIKSIINKERNRWFGASPELNIIESGFNQFQAGLYEFQVILDASEGSQLEKALTVRVEVMSKPLPKAIELDNYTIPDNLRNGSTLATITTIDPIDDIHTYSIEGDSNIVIEGNKLKWTGSSVPPTILNVTLSSTDRAGQTIHREVRFTRELAFNQFLLFPNPASSETHAKIQLDESANVTILIYDMTGRILINETTFEEETFIKTLKLDSLATGVYLVQVKIGQLVMTQRLIKN